VLDELGLNDWVAARTEASSGAEFILPQAVLHGALGAADPDGDGWRTRDELRAAFRPWLGSGPHVDEIVAIVLILFACERTDALAAAETERVAPFFANLRLMAHERHAPPEYVKALDPNVTLRGREVVVRKRDVPLTAERVRAVEAEWRSRVRRSDSATSGSLRDHVHRTRASRGAARRGSGNRPIPLPPDRGVRSRPCPSTVPAKSPSRASPTPRCRS
jgi:hypothetical protein